METARTTHATRSMKRTPPWPDFFVFFGTILLRLEPSYPDLPLILEDMFTFCHRRRISDPRALIFWLSSDCDFSYYLNGRPTNITSPILSPLLLVYLRGHTHSHVDPPYARHAGCFPSTFVTLRSLPFSTSGEIAMQRMWS